MSNEKRKEALTIKDGTFKSEADMYVSKEEQIAKDQYYKDNGVYPEDDGVEISISI